MSKRFGATVALDDVSLIVRAGEVHGLIGENGAGKSTLMKVLAGAIRPDKGRMQICGKVFNPNDPAQARAGGVAMIYQELSLAPHLSVEANITLGTEQTAAGVIRPARQRTRIREALGPLDHADLPLGTPVGRLPTATRQIVEIARALVANAQIIVMDEPTSSLGLADIERLFKVIESLKTRGVGIVYISHFLEEITRIADSYTVLRDGRVAGTGSTKDTTPSDLVQLMIGRSLGEMFPRIEHEPGPPVLELSDLQGRRMPKDACLTLRRGEILGIAGLVGAGRTELARAIYGLDQVRSGQVKLATDKDWTGAKTSPHKRLAQGIGLLSEDRATEGLALSRTISENTTLSSLKKVSRLGWIDRRAEREATGKWLQKLNTHCTGPDQRVSALSGGNQQKIALARLLYHDVDIIILDEPTRGIDVGSKTHIYRLIAEIVRQGKAILFISSYVPELLGVCHRIAVMRRGRLGEARPVADWTEHGIIAHATGTES